MKIPKILFGIPIIILVAIIINIIFDDLDNELFELQQPTRSEFKDTEYNETKITSSNLYSGPFAILDGIYSIDDTVFLIGSEIPLNVKGEITVIRPDGKIHHSLSFDGSKSAVNHYFTPVRSSDLEECTKCDFFGVWEISFTNNNEMIYSPIYFEVIDTR